MVQCAICDVSLPSEKLRKEHEVDEHSSLLESVRKHVDNVSTPGNTDCNEQFELFNSLGLCPTSKYKTTIVHELAKRTNLVKSFETLGPKIIGSFKCNYCPYETKLVFAVWAHMTSKHKYLKCEAEKKMYCLYCFLCHRRLNKRTNMLRHLDACINKLSELPITSSITDNPPRRVICEICDEGFDSLIELEKHTWGHAKK
ncbi:uncharacterized protein LOC107882929 [Acyrthosiphon pisum]|uniref:C2H2-type domain-containing protein n=1 Tax=Acyrthosiphon pisum TaxID=7029 RepID=A0A8R2JV97_ACYPI|nr:uncharacterized protein LOC107882929 [Acyrthosiphon pisum]